MKKLQSLTLYLIILCLSLPGLRLHAEEYVDTVAPQPREGFDARDLILPGALIAVGTAGIYWKSFRSLDHKVKDGMDHLRGNHYTKADDYLMLATPVVYFGLGFTGVKAKHSFRQRLAVELTSYLAMFALTEGLKYSIREERPDLSNRHSFPSGHTAIAFTGAELIREEYGPWWGTGAYVAATGVAFLRLYNNKHWLNDVIGGAGIGILSARIGYWMLPLYNKWFKWGDNPSKPLLTVAPSYNPALRAVALGIDCRF